MDLEWITATVDRVTFHNSENGYSVIKVTSRGHSRGLTVIGKFGAIHPGEEIRVCGNWVQHPQFGLQFHSEKYSTIKPASIKGIEKYLGSGLIKGVGPVTAKRLVAKFGIQTLEIIEKNPEKLEECEGIGSFRAEKIIKGWVEQKSVQDVMVFLQGHGISTAYAVKIFKSFGSDAITKVGANPYILAYEIKGIGFKTADKIAKEFGIQGNDPRRLQAGLLYALSESSEEGHLYLPKKELFQKTLAILEVNENELLEIAVSEQEKSGRLKVHPFKDEKLIYLPWLHRYEFGSVEILRTHLNCKLLAPPRERVIKVLERVFEQEHQKLSDQQQLAVEISLSEKLLILTGGPGTGKTTTLKAVVSSHSHLGKKVLLASPTGRAAKRLSEVTGMEAKTIHRLLEYSPSNNEFRFNQKNPLNCDTLILDECSMIDMELFYSLIKALPLKAGLIMVGDVDQLPSVGPGMVLKGLIDSETVRVIRLKTVFRQAETSLIISNAHRILRGEMPKLVVPDGKITTDCYFLDSPEPEKSLELLQNVVSKSLPRKFGLDHLQDIQVLTPMHRGSLGSENLNKTLQESLNPGSDEKREIKHLHRTFREGDKVIQNKNNYNLEVFNGDIGFIRKIEPEDQEISIEFPQGLKKFEFSDLFDLSLAYAITVHKSQGCEYPGVVLIISTQHFILLQRNLIYTAITRAKKVLVILGVKKAIFLGIKNEKIKERNTIFKDLLKEISPKNDQQIR
ncbi:MAG: ATP-dependent RecD-like DNA helicase [Candidatus Riflebacteria bacterium]|nr:ATP-dependent RecD-like DNA helicase [Candidatus Riflebacteria bacterium]